MFDSAIFDRLELLEAQNKLLTENNIRQAESMLGLLDALAERKKEASLLYAEKIANLQSWGCSTSRDLKAALGALTEAKQKIESLENNLADARAMAKIYLAEIEAVKIELLLVYNDLGELEEEVKARKPKAKTVRSLHSGHYYEVVAEGSSLPSYGGSHEVVVLKADFPNDFTEIVVVDASMFEEDFASVSG